ncbi:uncharacterized protein EI97DRAFT_43896 [Westerdykella ornata]|uniref:CENP-V/GFA domain-containing protein n=1 Tax=Westerdykella ornata TaxID=318751 RepID=A0A6A6JJZ9_WESOR|nr:uncharacterized protein EI97DRAFT_43896 [Westerdykella ornata]KAF2276555.1 hypothetical protein EI97DRAFT_43896 [Westerdykella ornata]
MADSKELTSSCFCGRSTYTFSVPTSSLPLDLRLCSCDISRRTSGTLFTSYITVPAGNPEPDLSTLTAYESSSILTRHFCSTCGTHMFLEYRADEHFEVASGTLQLESTDGIVDYKDHIWIEDTLDGGASQFVTHINDKCLSRYLRKAGESEQIPVEWNHPSRPPASETEFKKEEGYTAVELRNYIYAHCHCRGVGMYIWVPNHELATSPYPDLLIPFNLPDAEEKRQNHEDVKWFGQSRKQYKDNAYMQPTRHLAGLCACKSCRRASGFEITAWAFVPTSCITLDGGSNVGFQRKPFWPDMTTLKEYRSSEATTRAFCGTCGATVFCDVDRGEQKDGPWGGIIDVAVGLFASKSGTRAENMLAWWPNRVSFAEEALNKGLVKGLEEGMRAWAERNKGEDYVAVMEGPEWEKDNPMVQKRVGGSE